MSYKNIFVNIINDLKKSVPLTESEWKDFLTKEVGLSKEDLAEITPLIFPATKNPTP